MKHTDIQDALDEFDVRYLECCHQIPTKLVVSEWSQMKKLSSPLLAPQKDPIGAMSSVSSTSDSTIQNSVPRAQPELEESVPMMVLSSSNASSSCLSLDSRNYHSIDSRGNSPTSQLKSSMSTTSMDQFLQDPFASQYVNDSSRFNVDAFVTTSANRVSIPGSTEQNSSSNEPTITMLPPRRLNRSFSTSVISPKSSSRRAVERRSTITTYVGNPFYRRRNPQVKKSDGNGAT
ncbi:hypothetical protein EJF18_30649 [Clavispora lusitaniae]|uniref:Uncharacterized protein n=2 Tax=Clavispora lusitaniae TaxID=36911 RepID=C4Y4Q5_CLAL4|nr:uncharacterized protein CLUG_02627 [Clavispora lusitaniae ATCC 42720]KAF5211282.1 hypothetical protein E0198_002584 [Clavispora lusitaniae]EEQ38501.1 predicted protein [Clavispora lusitaniae ATCC 42720]KAF7580107.1 hypothetical protein FOB63_005177 [Clavispora lusitaniae]QFZ27668.1 hypothetical protein EJF14_30649 [Clavispora lusitaniae]QFZ33025.1 hypothetical protein EJF16_30649 [Clavispora lusitaniae]